MSQVPRIILLEDDPLQAEWIVEEIICKIKPRADVQYFDSEHSFLEEISNGNLKNWDPQYALIDLLVRYYSPEDLAKMGTAPDFDNLPVAKRAGVRCRQALLNSCPKTEIVIITVLDESPEGCIVIQKGKDELSETLSTFLKR